MTTFHIKGTAVEPPMTGQLNFTNVTDGVGKLTISNPSRRNAISASMWAAIPSKLDEIAQDSSVKVLIVEGDGGHFCAGADISEFEHHYATTESAQKISDDIANGFNALANFPRPTVAMIRGACVGGGCGVSLCCDIRFADNTARFAITPAKLGLIYPFNDMRRLIEIVGVANAKDLLLSARVIKAKRAERMGLINKLLKPDDLEDHVMTYATSMGQLSSRSLAITKKMIAAYQDGQSSDNLNTKTWFVDGFSSVDFQEGYSAFLEKRKPRF